MKISFSTFPYLNYPLEEAIRRISKCGYEAVEIWGGRPHAYAGDLEKDDFNRIRALLKKEKLEISAFIPAQFRYPTNLCINNEKIRQNSIQYIKNSIDTGVSLGAGVITVCPGHSIYGQSHKNAWNFLKESLEELTGYAEKKKVVLALEPAHPYETDLILISEDAIRMIEEVKSAHLKVLLDIGHLNVTGEIPATALNKLKDLLIHIHIDDNNGKMDDHLIPGEGSINFIPFLKALTEIGYQGYLAVELGFGYTLNPDESALEAIDKITADLNNIDKN